MPIAEISPYMNKWTVKARIASRSQLRSFQRKGGGAEGKVFHVELVDAGGGEIRASFFDQAAVGHYELLQVGKVFTFSSKGAQIKIANRQYNNTNSRYELTFDKGAQIMESSGEIAAVPVVFAFTDLRAVQSRTLPCRVDLVGVVKEFRPVATVRTKEGKELSKRDIMIADDTSSSMRVTLWHKTAERPDTDFEGMPMVALKSVILKEWNGGRDGSLSESSVILLNPEGLPEAARIQQWWSQGGKSQNLTPLGASGGAGGAAKNAQRVSVSEMRRNAEMVSDKPELFTVPVRLVAVQTSKQGEKLPLHYNACAEPRQGSSFGLCNKKVDAQGYCASCQRTGRTEVRLAVRGRFSDFGDSAWMTTFHEAAVEVLGMSGEKVAELEREQLEAALRQQYFLEPMEVTVRAKLDAYNGEFRTNTCVISAKPVDRRANGRKMLSEIQELIS